MKSFIVAIFSLCVINAFAQNVKTPEEFLKYKLGEHYTPYYKVVNYFKLAVLSLSLIHI